MSRQEFYKTKAWKDNRRAFALDRNCICERCGRAVYVTGINDYLPKARRLRYVVHHKEYLNDSNYLDDNISLDWNNLELLCIECHNQEHSKGGAIRDGLFFDENGNIVEKKKIERNPPHHHF